MKKRFLSLALSAALTLSVLTPAALAAEYVEIVPPKYDRFQSSVAYHYWDGLLRAHIDEEWRCDLLDANGKVVVPYERYDYVNNFSEGLAAVRLDGKYGFIDTTGKEVIPLQFDGNQSTYFSEGLAAVRSGEKWGYIDQTGNAVTPIQYNVASGFTGGLATIKMEEKAGYIGQTGKETFLPGYSYLESYGNVFIAGNDPTGSRSLVDKTGKLLFEDVGYADSYNSELVGFYGPIYAGPEAEGLGKITINGKWGFINDDGEAVIPLQYDSAEDFSEGLAAVRLGDWENGKLGFIDTTGKEIIPFQYDDAGSFSDGLAWVRVGDWETGKYSFIDRTGKTAFPVQYEGAKSFADGLAAVKSGGKWGAIDTAGNVVIPFQYEDVDTGYGKLVAVCLDDKWGLAGPASTTPAPTVPPSPCAVTLNGKAITLNAYLFTENGGGSNYVMLRDVAMLLSGTKAQFDVSWAADVGITITTGSAYTPVGGELQGKGDGEKGYTANSSTITVDGKPISLGGYTIESNNYFKLRDLGNALGFTVDWDAATGTVVLSTNG